MSNSEAMPWTWGHEFLELVQAALLIGNKQPSVRRIQSGHYNECYLVEAPGRSAVLRIAPPEGRAVLFYEPNMMERGVEALRLVQDRTDLPVPTVVTCAFRRATWPRDFVILECLPGFPMTVRSEVDPRTALRQLGAVLSELHGIQCGEFGYWGPCMGGTRPSWSAAFAEMWRLSVIDVARTGHIADAALDLMFGLTQDLKAVLDEVEQASLLHLDAWWENVLIDERGNLTGLIDWDRSAWGDPDLDLAVLVANGMAGRSFWSGYGREPSTSDSARIRHQLYRLYDLFKVIVVQHARHGSPQLARETAKQAVDIARRV